MKNFFDAEMANRMKTETSSIHNELNIFQKEIAKKVSPIIKMWSN